MCLLVRIARFMTLSPLLLSLLRRLFRPPLRFLLPLKLSLPLFELPLFLPDPVLLCLLCSGVLGGGLLLLVIVLDSGPRKGSGPSSNL